MNDLIPNKPKPSAAVLTMIERAKAAGVPAELIWMYAGGEMTGADLLNLIEGGPMTQRQAERLATRDKGYRARKMQGRWVVWCDASDHTVEF